MAILYANQELSGYFIRGYTRTGISATGLPRSVSSVEFDTNFGRHAALPVDPGMLQIKIPAQTDFWFHCCLSFGANSSTGGQCLQFIDSTTGQVCFQLDPDAAPSPHSNCTMDLEYWDGAAFQEGGYLGQDFLGWRPHTDQIYYIDIHIVIDNTVGEATLYIDGQPVQSFSGDTLVTGVTAIDRIHLQSNGSSGSTTSPCFTEVVIATEDTRQMRVFSSYPTAAGTNTAWTGTYTEVDDDNPLVEDYDHIYATSNNSVETYAMENLSAVADNLVPLAVVTIARAKTGNGGSGPQNLQHVIRSSAADYTSSSVTDTAGDALGEQLVPTMVVWATDPAGGSWTVSQVNAMEVGVKSIA